MQESIKKQNSDLMTGPKENVQIPLTTTLICKSVPILSNNLKNASSITKRSHEVTFELLNKIKREELKEPCGNGDSNIKINKEIERHFRSNISQQLQTDNSSLATLESNMQFFKVTVQEILDNFFTTMKDFELYKKRFHDILSKSEKESIIEMEDFIKDVIQHIVACESLGIMQKHSDTIDSAKESSNLEVVASNEEKLSDFFSNSFMYSENKDALHLLVDDTSSFRSTKNRDHASEMQIHASFVTDDKKVVSADNFSGLMSKKLELDKYMLQGSNHLFEKDIPVKNSSAKRNITNSGEEMSSDHIGTSVPKSLMTRICGYICRILHK